MQQDKEASAGVSSAASVRWACSPQHSQARSRRSARRRRPGRACRTGIRGSTTWGTNLLRDAGALVEIVGLCDVNPTGSRWRSAGWGCHPRLHGLRRDDQRHEARAVIVTTVDATHADYVCRAMDLGLDPISEKPLCTHAEQAQRIVDVQKRTGRKLDVTFNARHEASAMKVKELLLAARSATSTRSATRSSWTSITAPATSGAGRAQAGQRHAALPQGQPSLRPVELVDRLGSAAGDRARAPDKYGVNGPFRHATAACARTSSGATCTGTSRRASSGGAVRGLRGPGRYYRDGCLTGGDQHPDTYSVQITYANACWSPTASTPRAYEGSRSC